MEKKTTLPATEVVFSDFIRGNEEECEEDKRDQAEADAVAARKPETGKEKPPFLPC